MTLHDVMAVILRYFTEFGKHAFQHITASIYGGIYTRVYRSLSHLLMSFLFFLVTSSFVESENV